MNIGPDEQTMLSIEEKPLKDRLLLSFILFYALGTLIQLPGSFFTTATDYWLYKFRDPNVTFNESSQNRTGLQAEFISDYSIVSNVSNVIFLALTLLLIKRVTLIHRMFGSLGIIILIFAFTSVFVQVNTDSWQVGFFVLTLISGVFITAGTSVFMVTLFELVSKFPPLYLPAVISGQSICGIVAALIEIFAISIGASSITSGFIYFLIGLMFVLLTLTLFILNLSKSDFFQFHLNKPKVEIEGPKFTKEKLYNAFNKIKFYILTMMIVLGGSVMIHPAVTSLVLSVNRENGSKWNKSYFTPVCTFLFYSLFDYIGRESSVIIKRPKNGMLIFICGVVRLGFLPMLMFCNAQPRKLPVVFDQDWIYIVLIIIFAYTNGYLTNLAVIRIVKTTLEEEKLIVHAMILVAMIASVGSCVLLSAVLVKAL